MTESTFQNESTKPRDSASAGIASKRAARSAFFKYYIHDGTNCCRLQLFGEFTETEVPDLMGCWNTARTTLGERKLVLDVCGLHSADDVAKRWLLEMAGEGATFLPETYLRDGLRPEDCKAADRSRAGIWARVMSIFRRTSAMEAQS